MQFKDRFNQKYKDNPASFGDKPMEIIKESLDFVSGKKALILGVGNGRNASYLLSKSFHVTGIDISEEGIKLLKNKFSDESNLKLLVGDAIEIEFDEKFDLVTAIGLLHFMEIDKVNKLIHKMKSLTKVGGVNVIATRMTQNLIGDLPHIFEHNELKNFYNCDGWKIEKYSEDKTKRAVIAQIIAKRID